MSKAKFVNSESPLTNIRACVFDAYGTLFDFTSATRHLSSVIGDKAETLSALWRDKQLQYTWLRTAQSNHADFWQVTGDALDFALEALEIESRKLRSRLMQLYLALDPFPEVLAALARLRAGGVRTAILSNGTPKMLNSIVTASHMDTLFDAILSVEEVGAFKPHPTAYRLAADRLATPVTSIAFLSSNAWDGHAASAFGMHFIWCNRYDQPRERLPGGPDRQIKTLAELPRLIGVN